MDLGPAAILAGIGGIGLYALGKAAREQRAITKSGIREPVAEDNPTLTEDLVAWVVGMVVLGTAIQTAPVIFDEARAWTARFQ